MKTMMRAEYCMKRAYHSDPLTQHDLFERSMA